MIVLNMLFEQTYDWSDARVVVTGAASGIGKEMVRQLLERGALVTALDIKAEGLVDLDALGRGICDVTDYEQCAEVLGRYGAFTHAFINHGVNSYGLLEHTPAEAMQRVLEVNGVGTFNVLKVVSDNMRNNPQKNGKRGHIIFTGSIAGLMTTTGSPAYAFTKHGLMGFVESAAVELEPDNIAVSCILPGFVETPMAQVDGTAETYGLEVAGIRAMVEGPFGFQPVQECVAAALNGVEKGDFYIYTSGYVWLAWMAHRFLPRRLTRWLAKQNHQQLLKLASSGWK